MRIQQQHQQGLKLESRNQKEGSRRPSSAAATLVVKDDASGRVSRAPSVNGKPTGASKKANSSEDHLALVFFGIILTFLVCHTPRVLLNLFEVATMSQTSACEAAGKPPFPFWVLATIKASHVLLAVNSATNMLVYCAVSSTFRAECKASLASCGLLRGHSGTNQHGRAAGRQSCADV